jgi:3-oxoacyl-[acyl-carrier protein] reductase
MDFGIKNKNVLITASSKGIGKAIAEQFAAEGCNIAICSRTKEDLINTSVEIKKKYGTEVIWCLCDLTRARDIENTIDIVNSNLGQIDILVNNCGGPPAGYFQELDDEKWQNAFEQVLLSVVRFCNLVVPGMMVKEWGRIINITSISVKQPIENLILSNSLRNGIVGFAKTLSNEIAKYSITVNNIAPGYTLTNRLYELAVIRAKTSGRSHEEILSDMGKEIPMNRLARPEEIASLAVYLASVQAGYLTGNTIHVDGGLVKGLY